MPTITLAAAVAILVRLAGAPGCSIQSEALAVFHRLDGGTVRRLLQRLARAGLVRIGRGPRGGATLVRPPELITILDVDRAIRPASPLGREQRIARVTGVPASPVSRLLTAFFGDLEKQRARALEGQTIADLAGDIAVQRGRARRLAFGQRPARLGRHDSRVAG